jgi:hypothetical protein
MGFIFTNETGVDSRLFKNQEFLRDGTLGNYTIALDKDGNKRLSPVVYIDAREGMLNAKFFVDGEQVETRLDEFNNRPAHYVPIEGQEWAFTLTKDKNRWTGIPREFGSGTPMTGYEEFKAACHAAKKAKQQANKVVTDDGKGHSTADLDSEDFEDEIPF